MKTIVAKIKVSDRALESIPWICCVLLVGAMTGVAELLCEKEIIFPEITALAVGYFVAPKPAWKVNSVRMWILISSCAVMGVLIVRNVPFSLFGQICVAFAISQVLYVCSRTTLAPFVSAIVLPVLLQSDGIVYPIAASILTLVVIIFHHIFTATGIREKVDFVPDDRSGKRDFVDMILRMIIGEIIAFFAVKMEIYYVAAPPLLVAFTEFSRPGHKAKKKPFNIVMLMFVAAMIGASFRYILCMTIGVPLFISAALATAFFLIDVKLTELYVPPAGAILVLAFLIPEEQVLLYAGQILVGMSLVMLASVTIFGSWRDEEVI